MEATAIGNHRFEYIAPSGRYGRFEETATYYGKLGWKLVHVDFHFKEIQKVGSTNPEPEWVAVFEREIYG